MKKLYKTLLIILLTYFLNPAAASAQAGACAAMDRWDYVRPVWISNNNPVDYSDFQAQITLNTQALISNGMMQPKAGDLRILDSLCRPLQFWIDTFSINTANTLIWVKVKSLPRNTGANIYMYYGNLCINPITLNPDSVFTEFDPMNDTTNWTRYNGDPYVVSNGTVTTGGGYAFSQRKVAMKGPFISEFRIAAASGGFPNIGQTVKTANNTSSGMILVNSSNVWFYSITNGGGTGWGTGYTGASGVFMTNWVDSLDSRFGFNGNYFTTTATPRKPTDSLRASFGVLCCGATPPSITIDWYAARRYAPAQPMATVRAQEVNFRVLTFSKLSLCPGLDTLKITFTIPRPMVFNGGNTFTVQMSDGNGSFASPTLIGSYVGTTGNSFTLPILKTAIPGVRYRMRVLSTNPVYNCFVSVDSFAIRPKPNPSFNFKDSLCFRGNRYTFNSTSTIASGTIAKHYWKYGDLTQDSVTTASVNHHYTTYFGTYRVLLTEKSNFGCTDTLSKLLHIKETPDADFLINKDVQCFRGNLFKYTSLSAAATSTLSHKWYFGDGDSASTNDSAKHHYRNAGSYQNRLVVKTIYNCYDTANLYVLVNAQPVASFTINDSDQCFRNHRFRYRNTSTISSGVGMRTYWSFGDGSIDSLKDTLSKSFALVNTYSTRLIVLSDDGCADTVKHKVYVFPMPVAAYSIDDNQQCRKGNRFKFTSSSSIPSGTIQNNWTYGDGNADNNVNTSFHSYANAGSYKSVLHVVSDKGCIDTLFKNLVVDPSPVASYTKSSPGMCAKNNLFKFKSTSTISAGTYTRKWNFNDGSPEETTDSVKHSFPVVGTYNVRLIINSDKNCADTAIDSVKLYTMPAVTGSVDKNAQCQRGNSFIFKDNSSIPTGRIMFRRWFYDDGDSTLNVPIVIHSYANPGIYNVSLVVSSDMNCTDTAIIPVEVYEHPEADFSINDTDQCQKPNRFIFGDLTYAAAGHTNTWNFGDGSAEQKSQSAVKRYQVDNRTFTVTLVSVSGQGCADTIAKKVIVFADPDASFTIDNPTQCERDNLFKFTSTSSIPRGSYTHSWSFGDGNLDGDVAATSHSYDTFNNLANPTYTISLVLTSDKGCGDTARKVVKVNPMPVASFLSDKTDTCLINNKFTFAASSTLYNNGTLTHNWTLGDGNTETNTPAFSHSYSNYGTYTITLISTSIDNCADTTDGQVTVNPMPAATFTVDNDSQCVKGNVFNFTNTSNVVTGSIDASTWDFGDTSTDNSMDATHTYLYPKNHTVRLIVSTDKGCNDTASNLVVTHPMPVAGLAIVPPAICFKGHRVNATNKSTISSGSISTYKWEWGDGATDNQQTPNTHSYAASGSYTVILTATSIYGCEDTAQALATIHPTPVVDFSVAAACLRDSSVFINNSNIATGGSIASYKWLFGDGKSSVAANPRHQYKTTGSYDVSLIAISDKGCRDTMSKTGTAVVNPLPTASFTFTKIRSWETETDVQFTSTSSADATRWDWDFGNGNSSIEENPIEYYTDSAQTRITLVVTNGFGCKDTAAQNVFIAPDVVFYFPDAFSPNNDDLNESFKPIGLAYAKAYKFIIFNRWGEVLFKTSNPTDSWNGRYMGEVVQQGTYYYRVEFVGVDEIRREAKGYITILR